jgi:hypothetical protein
MPDNCPVCDKALSEHPDGLACCPFCGPPGNDNERACKGGGEWAECPACGCMGPVYDLSAWNRRAPTARETALAARVEELEDRLIALNHAYYSDGPRAKADFYRLLNMPVKEQQR